MSLKRPTQGAIENAAKVLNAQIAIAEELAKSASGRKTQPRIAFRFATPVFDSRVGRIGLLSPELSFKVSSVYGHFKGFNTQAQDQVPEMDPALAVRIMRSVHDTLWKLSADAEVLDICADCQRDRGCTHPEDLMFVGRVVRLLQGRPEKGNVTFSADGHSATNDVFTSF